MPTPEITAHAAVAGAAAAAVTYAPTELVIVCAILGGALSVWTQAAAVQVTLRALIALAGQFATSVAVGIGGTAAAQVLFPQYAMLAPFAAVPDWAQALGLAGGAQLILATVSAILKRKSNDV